MLLTGCSKDSEVMAQTMTQKMYITIDGKTLSVELVDNAATQTLVAALQEGDITYEAHDYGGFEKVGALGRSLPTSDTQTTTQAGDVILYNGNQIVLFYGSNSWSYTRLGHMEYSSQAELESLLWIKLMELHPSGAYGVFIAGGIGVFPQSRTRECHSETVALVGRNGYQRHPKHKCCRWCLLFIEWPTGGASDEGIVY